MWYDLIVLVMLMYATYRGAAKGIVWQIAVIGSLVLCFTFAGKLSLSLSPYIGVEPPLDRWVAMFILYAGFSFLAFGAARVLREWIEKAKFVEYDRHLGAILGFLKGATFALFFTFFAVTLSESARAHVLGSYSGYAAAIVMDRLHPVMPEGLHEVLEPFIHQLDQPGMNLHYSHDGKDVHGRADESKSHEHKDSHDDGQEHLKRSAERIVEPEDSAGKPEDPLREIVSVLPGIFDPELKTAAYEALANTREVDRTELIEKLSCGIPGLIRTVSLEWKNGKPGTSSVDPTERQNLVREIAGMYSEFPSAQVAVIDEIETSLAHLPDRVVLNVLRDWRADQLESRPDPDPQTNLVTPLDVRIVHQLAAARISVTSLPDVLQDRLRKSLPR